MNISWKIIDDFYIWLYKRGHSKFESGLFCKYIATFFDLFLRKFFSGVRLEDISMEIIKRYLGYWYPMYADFASLEDIKFQIETFKIFCLFLEERKNTELPDIREFLGEEGKILLRFKEYRDLKANCIDFFEFEERLKEWLMERW